MKLRVIGWDGLNDAALVAGDDGLPSLRIMHPSGEEVWAAPDAPRQRCKVIWATPDEWMVLIEGGFVEKAKG